MRLICSDSTEVYALELDAMQLDNTSCDCYLPLKFRMYCGEGMKKKKDSEGNKGNTDTGNATPLKNIVIKTGRAAMP